MPPSAFVPAPGAGPIEIYLDFWDWMIVQGYYYCNEGEWRLDGSRGCVDCSGGVKLACEMAGRPMPAELINSWGMARYCHETPRPQWLVDLCGPDYWTGSFTMGTGISMAQALDLFPAALAYHGANQGQDDVNGVGHIKSRYWSNHPFRPLAGYNVSVEAMSHAADLVHAHFADPNVTYVALAPNLLDLYAPAAVAVAPEETMLVACNNKPLAPAAHGGNKPYAQLVLPNAIFPRGIVVCRHGASIAGDKPVKGSDARTWFPASLKGKLIGMCELAGGKGVLVVDDTGETSKNDGGKWS